MRSLAWIGGGTAVVVSLWLTARTLHHRYPAMIHRSVEIELPPSTVLDDTFFFDLRLTEISDKDPMP